MAVKKEAPAAPKAKATKEKPEKTIKVPKSLAACADLIKQVQDERLALNSKVEQLKKDEAVLREHLIKNLSKDDTTGVAGKLARVNAEAKHIPQVKDWKKLREFIKKTGNWQLIQNRLSESAVQELWDAKKKVPGVDVFKTTVLRIHKVK